MVLKIPLHHLEFVDITMVLGLLPDNLVDLVDNLDYPIVDKLVAHPDNLLVHHLDNPADHLDNPVDHLDS